MSKRLRRIVSFILAMIMTLSSLNFVYAADDNTGTGGGTGSGTGSESQNQTDEIGTGYKIQLVFLELDDATYKNKNTPEGKQAVIEAWNNAKTGFYDSSAGEFTVQRIGEPIYLTTNQIKSAQKAPTIGFKFGDFDYGLGSKKDSVTISRNLFYSNSDGSDISVSPSDINSALSTLKSKCQSEGSGMENFLTLDNSTLPILIGGDGSPYLQNQGDNALHNYLLKNRPADKKTDKNSEYIVNQNFIALVNYISTKGGKSTDDRDVIYFHEVADSAGNQIELEVPEDAASIFDKGLYRGAYGEYRLIVSPYWNVNASYTGGRTALTLRDMAFIGEQEGTGSGTLVYTQEKYFKILARVARLVDNDMFNLQGVTASEANCSSTSNVYDKLNANKGIGISIFTSSMADDGTIEEGKDLYIGSIAHVFMPGSLSSADETVKSASMEYIGTKSNQNATEDAFEKAAIQIAKALAGGSTDGDNNVYANTEFN